MDLRNEILEAMEDKKIIFGMKRSIDAVKHGEAKKIIYAKNVPEIIKKDIVYYAELTNIEAIEFDGNNMQLGVVCRRPHSISVLAILK